MKFVIKHEIPGRMRVHFAARSFSFKQADKLEYVLLRHPGVTSVKIYERTADAAVTYTGDRTELIHFLQNYNEKKAEVPEDVLASSGRAITAEYKDKLITTVLCHYGRKFLLPAPIRAVYNAIHSVKFIAKGVKSLLNHKLEVSVLDATAIGVSILRGDTNTAGSVMFLLTIGEIMEEWTHKKSVDDLARSMSLKVENVWMVGENGQEILVPSNKIVPGDTIVVTMGSMIPFDGKIVGGEGMVNQASLTGESVPVHRRLGGVVFAGTVLEEGDLTIQVTKASGASRYEKIVSMIEETEKLKSSMESRAEHLADKLVPYTLGGTALTYLLTRNVTKTLSVLMVDFSCALKLAMPITVLSAIREAGNHHITVKGGKFLEAVAESTTIVFDKTGTLTKARPTFRKLVPFCDLGEDELLTLAACLEEHFPHSMAKAVVQGASDRGLTHEEHHTKVEYIVAHGIASTINGKRCVIGSEHFVLEDEHCRIDENYRHLLDELPTHYSRLFLAVDGQLLAVLCIEDPVKEDAARVLKDLKAAGFTKIVMMTGDSKRTAEYVAEKLGVDEVYAEVLPEDKANYVLKEKALGNKVIMVGDGINDSPALSAADVGIAISDGAELAREIADITISSSDLSSIVELKKIGNAMVRRINHNYTRIMGINGTLIALGVGGIIQPTTSATFHNLSTLAISMSSMTPLI